MPPGNARERKKLLIKLSIAAVAILLLAALALFGVNIRALAERGLGLLRGGGPWVFFLAMAVLPAVGVPITMFLFTAGPAFAGQMGMGGVVAAGLAAGTVNLALAYWLARKALRPWLVRLVVRLGYSVPRVEPADMTDMIVLLRVTPGIPFPVQNYLLGLAEVPFGKYFGISILAASASNVAFIVFGDALLNGKGKVIFCAAGLIIALMAAGHLVRRHYAGRAKRMATVADS